MEILVDENECWVCGTECTEENKTMHHTLPQHLKPKKNVVVPVCQPCHDEINMIDATGMLRFAQKLHKTSERLTKQAAILNVNIRDLNTQTIASMIKKKTKKR